jgi:hypothetical protein
LLSSTHGNAVITATAPVLLTPDEHRQPLVVAKEGSVVRRLATQGSWYQVEFDDPVYGRRTGYVQAAFVKIGRPPTDASAPSRPLGVVPAAPAPRLPARPSLDDDAVAAAVAAGEHGDEQALAYLCSSARLKESMRHPGTPVVVMRAVGARGDIAAQAADAAHAGREWTTPVALRAWHLQVVVRTDSGARIDAVALRTESRAALPDALSWDGVAMFSGAAAHAVVAAEAFDIVATVGGGTRTCTVTARDKQRLGL